MVIDRKVILGKKAHDEAVEKIESWKRGENKYSDAELWKARNIIESMEHPQTKEIINPIGRMSCFVPANIPIQIGMLLAPPTVFVSVELCELQTFNIILWQWINQSYNAVFNYCNRNTSTESNTTDIVKAYCSATIVSVSVALAGNKLVQKCGGGGLLGKVRTLHSFIHSFQCIPWFAVACAGAANVYLMRFKETRSGIAIKDAEGNELGVSKKAGVKAVNLTALTRVILPTPGMILNRLIDLQSYYFLLSSLMA